MNANGIANQQTGRIDRRQICLLHRLLHHEGDIGADHDHLTVRHVDDAHDAEGDRQTGGGQQQDGTEADTVINTLQQRPKLQVAIDLRVIAVAAAGGDRRRPGRSGCPACCARFEIAAIAQDLEMASIRSTSELSGAASIAAARACSMRRFTLGIGFLRQARSNAGKAAGSRARNTASAAASRAEASGANSRNTPSASSIRAAHRRC